MHIQKEVIEGLKNETKRNPAANAVFHLLAVRKRSRSSLMLAALGQRMRKEGFNYTPAQYREVLETLSKSGLATPVKNRRGRLVGIKNIQTRLPDLGKLACGATANENEQAVVKTAAVRSIEKATGIKISPITTINVEIEGKQAVLQFPKGLTVKELSVLLEALEKQAS